MKSIEELETWLGDLDARIESIQTQLNHLHRYRRSISEEIRLRRELAQLETQFRQPASTTGSTGATPEGPAI